MFIRKLLAQITFIFLTQAIMANKTDNWPDIRGPYLGQKPPGMQSKIFAPGIISTDQSEINSVFSTDGNEFYFTTWSKESGTRIMYTKQINSQWTRPKVAPVGSITDAYEYRKSFPDGRIGSDPTQATVENGERLIEIAAESLNTDYQNFLDA